MLGVLDGTSLLEMATKWDVTQSAVTKWLAAYVERGLDGLTPTKPAGPQSRLSPEQLEDVGRWKVTRKTTTHNRYFDTPEQRDAALIHTFVNFQRNPALVEAQVQRFRA